MVDMKERSGPPCAASLQMRHYYYDCQRPFGHGGRWHKAYSTGIGLSGVKRTTQVLIKWEVAKR